MELTDNEGLLVPGATVAKTNADQSPVSSRIDNILVVQVSRITYRNATAFQRLVNPSLSLMTAGVFTVAQALRPPKVAFCTERRWTLD